MLFWNLNKYSEFTVFWPLVEHYTGYRSVYHRQAGKTEQGLPAWDYCNIWDLALKKIKPPTANREKSLNFCYAVALIMIKNFSGFIFHCSRLHISLIWAYVLIWKEGDRTQMFLLFELCVFCVIHFIRDCLLHKKILLIYSEIYILPLSWPMLYIFMCMCTYFRKLDHSGHFLFLLSKLLFLFVQPLKYATRFAFYYAHYF